MELNQLCRLYQALNCHCNGTAVVVPGQQCSMLLPLSLLTYDTHCIPTVPRWAGFVLGWAPVLNLEGRRWVLVVSCSQDIRRVGWWLSGGCSCSWHDASFLDVFSRCGLPQLVHCSCGACSWVVGMGGISPSSHHVPHIRFTRLLASSAFSSVGSFDSWHSSSSSSSSHHMNANLLVYRFDVQSCLWH
jgi:hypothetical protein